ncbi:hypothetical protein [Bacillus sp. Au-Bac7]|uniref:hypothetical protein n=1 Tax=Bacillus sp. Au-Bac7 TaxID=2906458 RepID=UPI001E50757F|nr:hypothetical protein [Bacillus sp. Au-Bac7]MCE4051706.1 hypothetical protein [Bacillus sp. Au-Bac7]
MQVFSTFEHSLQLELAIREIEQKGIHTIFAVPLDSTNPESIGLFDTIHRSDGVSLINKGIVFAVFFSVLGASRGFVLEWGPIYWGLIGAISGFILGFLIDLFLHRGRKVSGRAKGKTSEVLIIIECGDTEHNEVEKILWKHFALSVGKVH